MKSRIPVALFAIMLCVSGCGTAVYSHTITIRLSDPSRRLGPGPIRVGTFDRMSGYSEGGVAERLGVSSDSAPYVAKLNTTGGATLLDPPRPRTLDFFIAVPALEPAGFFLIELEPRVRPSGEARALFCKYGSYFPDEDAPFVTVTYSAAPDPKGWRVALVILVPTPPGTSERVQP